MLVQLPGGGESQERRGRGAGGEAVKMRTQRLFDLVRHQRSELYEAGLLTDGEYNELLLNNLGAVDRLESYDEPEAELARLRVELEWAQAATHAAQADAEREKSVADTLRAELAAIRQANLVARDLLALAQAELAEAKRDIDEYQREHDALMEYARTTKGSRDVHSVYEVLDSLKRERDAAREDGARLRAALERNRQGMQNILEFRKVSNDRYGDLTREEIEGVIAEIDAARKGGK